MKKSGLILLSCLILSACECPQVDCHVWTTFELRQMQAEDAALPSDAVMHALIKNYESICLQ